MKKLLLLTTLCVGLFASCSSSTNEIIEEMENPGGNGNVSNFSDMPKLPKGESWGRILNSNSNSEIDYYSAYTNNGNTIKYMVEYDTLEHKLHLQYTNLDNGFDYSIDKFRLIDNGININGKNYNKVVSEDSEGDYDTYGYNHTTTYQVTYDGDKKPTRVANHIQGNKRDPWVINPIFNSYGYFNLEEIKYETSGDLTTVKFVSDYKNYEMVYNKKRENIRPKTILGVLGYKDYQLPDRVKVGNEVYTFTYNNDLKPRFCVVSMSGIKKYFIFFYN